MNAILAFCVGIIVSIISGFSESVGISKTDQMWNTSWTPNFKITALAILGFIGSVAGYMLSVKLFKLAKINAPEIHFNLWYLGAVIGVAFISRRFFSWETDVKISAICVVALVLWISYRTGGS